MERIGNYNVNLGENGDLGGGSFGSVHKATHITSGEQVAVKKARRPTGKNVDPVAAKEFEEKYVMNELEALNAINHPNIVRFYDSVLTKFFLYIFLEYCIEGSLSDFVDKVGNLLLKMKVLFMKQMAAGVQCLHLNHFWHRDLKPENILVQVEEHQYIVKLTDFGIAKKVTHASAVGIASSVGTESWMAPEVYPEDGYARYSSSADIFSLGLVFLSLLEHVAGKSLQALKGKVRCCYRKPHVAINIINKTMCYVAI